MKKTKMICTIGPATNEYEKIVKLLKSGMNVARLNMSHGDLKWHQGALDLIKKARKNLMIPCSIMIDTCGPEIRIGTFKNGKITLKKGDEFTFTTKKTIGDKTKVSCLYPELLKVLKVKQRIFANNGLLMFSIKKILNGNIICNVDVGGDLSDHKSISIPHVRLPLPFVSKKDEANIKFAVDNNAEYISASFVNSKQDVLKLKSLVKKLGGKQEIIAKIETAQGLANLEEIIEVSDGIMVARGDMGTEIPLEHIPATQKKMILQSIAKGKKVIVATEMLESMTTQRRPTRAETTDVAQAVYDKSDATMLSEETAAGDYPIESATMMNKIARATENVIDYDADFSFDFKTPKENLDAISYSACATARAIGAKAIVCFTDAGKTANHISTFRPKAQILALTHDYFTFNKLSLTWGVEPFLVKEQSTIEDLLMLASEISKDCGLTTKGDKIVVTLGIPIKDKGITNTVKISEVE